MSSYQKRRAPFRKKEKVILIICEGETEENYFRNFDKREWENIIIKIPKTGNTDPLGLVKAANHFDKKYNPDITWCVFDVEDFDQSIIDKAFKITRSNNIVILSNPCFEFWFLIHFNYVDCCLSSKGTYELLKKNICDYEKPKNIFNLIEGKTNQAIKNAKKINKKHLKKVKSINNVNCNPSTQVYKIVEYIFKEIKKD